MLTDEFRYRILKRLEANPELSQRELARELGVSVGKVNYGLRALVDLGLIKINNFVSSRNKGAYVYVLTARGIRAKASTAVRYFRQKLAEHEVLQAELEELRREVRDLGRHKKRGADE
ncbi:MAG TPA: MarR family EPS-associated transcriptional regulator [Steroidobacteraceae bacterium]|nr:MarR family EPS-associated transcriptional regulator [Steroidobacteraceae bacterium]